MDTWHLNNAVYLMEDFLKKATDPPADAVVEYGDRAGHCWSGHDQSVWFRSLETRILETAPKGADRRSWRYRPSNAGRPPVWRAPAKAQVTAGTGS